MPSNNQINLPAGYAPAFAIGFSDQSGDLSIVDAVKPLPVALQTETPILVQQASPNPPAALEGLTSVDMLAGPFAPAESRPIVITLSGQWTGEVQVQRTVDGGTTLHNLTVAGVSWGFFTSNACEVVWIEEEAGAELYLDITITSGNLEYRIAQ